MADRVFAGIALLVVLVYGWIAFTRIKAPFQYDPLGPETWPQILAIVAALCSLYILVRPDADKFDLNKLSFFKVAAMILLLIIYAALFQPIGFILSTAIFCTLAALLLGAVWWKAVLFGLVTGMIGYGIGDRLLSLNLPDGLLSSLFYPF